MDHGGSHHFADGSHVALRGVVHPLRVSPGKALLYPASGTEMSHRHRLVHGSVVGQDPRDAVGFAQLGFHTYNELGEDVHPLGLRLGEETKDAAGVVVNDGEKVKVAFWSWHGERASEV